MQATINYIYAQPIATREFTAPAIIRKEARMKIMLFAGILACLALAVNI